MKKISIFLFLFLLSANSLCAQTKDSYDYNKEFIFGVNKNSFGGLIGGFVFKKSIRVGERSMETYGLELMNVKNPHEVKVQAASGNSFILGKSNYLYAVRLQYGRDLILFTKAPQQGVEIKAVFAIGPSIGVVTPYYVQIADPSNPYAIATVPYTNQSAGDIEGVGGFAEGLGHSKIQMGGNVKVALNFEWGATKTQVGGFEAGFLLDAYTSKVTLMPVAPNYAIYPTVFLTLFYGSRK